MYGFQDYVDVLKNYIEADQPESYIQQVIQVFDDYRILAAVKHGALGLNNSIAMLNVG